MVQEMGYQDGDVVSVVMPLYNGEGYVAEAIASVRAQTHERWELLVVDDGSKDRGPVIVAEIARTDPRVRLIRQANAGAAAARNAGLDAARGAFITYLDCDDWWEPHALQAMLEVCKEHGAAYGHYRVTGPAGEVLVTQRQPFARVGLQELLDKHAVWTCANMVRAEVMRGERFDLGQVGYEDHDLWLRLAHQGVVWHEVGSVIANYRIRPASHSKNHHRTLAGAQRAQVRAYDRLLRTPVHERRAMWDDARQSAKLHELAIIYATRAAVSHAGSPEEAAQAALAMFAQALGPRDFTPPQAAQHGFWAIIYECGLWPDFRVEGDLARAHKLGAFWRACEVKGWCPGGTSEAAWPLLCKRVVRDEAVAEHLLDVATAELARGGAAAALSIVGLGQNGRLLAQRAARRGLRVHGRDDRAFAGDLGQAFGPGQLPAEVVGDRMDGAVAPGVVAITPLEDAELLRRFGHLRPLTWNRAREDLCDALAARAAGGMALHQRVA